MEALTLDAENDIVFNFFSLLFPIIGQKVGWKYLDPLGGALLSVYSESHIHTAYIRYSGPDRCPPVIFEWSGVLFENAQKLTGKRATPAEHQRVAYLLTRFSPLILGIQHLSVYAAGDHSIVEADIVLSHKTSLRISHNVAESAQYCLESLTGVERAYVHVDVTYNKLSGHFDRS